MPLTEGTRLGSYEILSPLGAGGMGEVYRARDTKLSREVAIKILPEAFVSDADRIARFRREAQLLAALNHPHIAGIHGLEESETSRFLVLELVEGESLAQVLAKGTPIPVDEALAIARQMADALEAAHEKGIIHRDLKPANIMLTPDGQVKVLDFGLAKASLADAATAATDHSPTLTFAGTNVGVILGTAAYMSPEQAKGRAADKRSDVWAFGCVLFEMLSGKRAFDGEDATEIIAAVVRGEPEWRALPPTVPEHIRTLVKRCLVKDRKQRIADISVALYMMNETPAAAAVVASAAPPVPRRRLVSAASLGVAAGLLLAAAAWMLARPAPPTPVLPARFAIVPPPAQPLSFFAGGGADRDIAISPMGTHIAYRSGTGPGGQLMVRAIDQLDAQPLAGISGARQPFFSPDGRWIGFVEGTELKKVSITGGPAMTLSNLYGTNPRGTSWGEANTIVFATGDPATGLMSVPAGGGEPKELTKPDATQRGGDHWFPSALPGGRGVLFTITAPGQADNSQVAVLDLTTGKYQTLLRGGSHAEYLESGHLVYASAGTLRAVRFDLARLEVLSDPVPVVEHVMVKPNGAANFAVSRDGTLVYIPGGQVASTPRSLVWVDRKGREEPLKAAARTYVAARISPDGTRVALGINDQENDIWVWDLARHTLTRLTFDPASERNPVWTPDGRHIIFSSARAGPENLYRHAADGTGADERLTTSPNSQFANSVLPDGTRIAGVEISPKTAPDIVLFAFDSSSAARGTGGSAGSGQRPPEPLVQTPFVEFGVEISPDGRYIAYHSNESGRGEIYVRPFPKVDGGRWQVSTGGGTWAAWGKNRRELFYLDGSGTLTAVPVQMSGPNFSAGNPAKVFDTRYATPPGVRPYDVSPDGQRFLMIKEGTTAGEKTPPASLVVVLNWFEELKARVPIQ